MDRSWPILPPTPLSLGGPGERGPKRHVCPQPVNVTLLGYRVSSDLITQDESVLESGGLGIQHDSCPQRRKIWTGTERHGAGGAAPGGRQGPPAAWEPQSHRQLEETRRILDWSPGGSAGFGF